MTTPNATTSSFSRRCRHCGQALDPASSFCSKCGATAELPGGKGDPLRESLQALFGRELEIQDELGRGGMAAVYAAFDPALQRRVAVKVLLPDMTDEPGIAGKFLQEARTVAALQHPHVVTVYGVKANETTQAIVMQFVEGRSLDTVIKGRTSRLPIPVAGLILSQAASGLQHAHDRGIIHRDVKPANVLLDHDGRAIVSDFGIARRDTAPRTTATGFVIGTWSYMSPEQRQAQSVSGATDQYALGVMAFEILTGELPFTGTVMEVLAKHLDEPVPSLRALRPEIPAPTEALVHRMMAKNPSDRFASMRDAERAFKALVPDEGGTTQIIAGYSHVQEAVQKTAGSAVFAAPKVAGLVSNSLTASREAETVRTAPGAAGALVPASRSNTRVAVGAGAVLLVIAGVAWQLTHRAPQTVANGAPAAQMGNGVPVTPAQRADSTSSATRSSAQVMPSTSGAPSPGTASGTTSAKPAEPAANSQLTAPVASPPVAPPANSSRADSAPVRVVSAPAPSPSADAPPALSATVADARKIGKDFATMLNRRQFRELGQVPSTGGDAAQRAELIRLTQNATDFAAGFDRIASAPERSKDGFVTDFVLDLEWQGGHKLMLVTAFATMQGGAWRLAGWSAETPR